MELYGAFGLSYIKIMERGLSPYLALPFFPKSLKVSFNKTTCMQVFIMSQLIAARLALSLKVKAQETLRLLRVESGTKGHLAQSTGTPSSRPVVVEVLSNENPAFSAFWSPTFEARSSMEPERLSYSDFAPCISRTSSTTPVAGVLSPKAGPTPLSTIGLGNQVPDFCNCTEPFKYDSPAIRYGQMACCPTA